MGGVIHRNRYIIVTRELTLALSVSGPCSISFKTRAGEVPLESGMVVTDGKSIALNLASYCV